MVNKDVYHDSWHFQNQIRMHTMMITDIMLMPIIELNRDRGIDMNFWLKGATRRRNHNLKGRKHNWRMQWRQHKDSKTKKTSTTEETSFLGKSMEKDKEGKEQLDHTIRIPMSMVIEHTLDCT